MQKNNVYVDREGKRERERARHQHIGNGCNGDEEKLRWALRRQREEHREDLVDDEPRAEKTNFP